MITPPDPTTILLRQLAEDQVSLRTQFNEVLKVATHMADIIKELNNRIEALERRP